LAPVAAAVTSSNITTTTITRTVSFIIVGKHIVLNTAQVGVACFKNGTKL
jgi:hypothetical protein